MVPEISQIIQNYQIYTYPWYANETFKLRQLRTEATQTRIQKYFKKKGEGLGEIWRFEEHTSIRRRGGEHRNPSYVQRVQGAMQSEAFNFFRFDYVKRNREMSFRFVFP